MYSLPIGLLVFKLIAPSITYKNPCEGKVFIDKYYEEKILFNGLHKPTNLVMHEHSNSLFFSHTVRIGGFIDFNIRVCHITNLKCKNIKQVFGGRAIAYDRKNDRMYLGGRKGIYIYNFTSKSAQHFAEKGTSIWNLFVQKHLYYIDSNTRQLFVYKDKKFKPVTEVLNIEIDNFFVSKSFTMYYSNRTALYRAHRPVRPAKVLDNSIHVRQITQDYAGDYVFFAANEGVYYVNDEDHESIKKASDISQIFGMTFKKSSDSEFEPGNLIFSSKTAIIRLIPGKHGDQCLEVKSKKSLFYMPEKNRRPFTNVQ